MVWDKTNGNQLSNICVLLSIFLAFSLAYNIKIKKDFEDVSTQMVHLRKSCIPMDKRFEYSVNDLQKSMEELEISMKELLSVRKKKHGHIANKKTYQDYLLYKKNALINLKIND